MYRGGSVRQRRPLVALVATMALVSLCEASPAAAESPMPHSAIELSFRPAFNVWLVGRAAQESISSVFPTLPSTAFDLGYRFAQTLQVYLEWQHDFYRVGEKNPYARLDSAVAYRNFFGLGFRRSGKGDASIVWDAALGYSAIGQSGGDSHGGTASISLPSWQARTGLGLSFRVNEHLGLEPLLLLDLGDVGSYTSDVQVADGRDRVRTGTTTDGLRLGLSIGLSATFGFPL
jgi:hypothetical protein